MSATADARKATGRLRRAEAEHAAVIAAYLAAVRARCAPLAVALAAEIGAARQAGVEVGPEWLASSTSWLMLSGQLREGLAVLPTVSAAGVSELVADALAAAGHVAGAAVPSGGGAWHADAAERMTGWVGDVMDRLPGVLTSGAGAVGSAVRDALDALAFHAGTIARTAQMLAYRGGLLTAWAAVGGVAGWTWVCVGDERTCAACWAMDGTTHPLSETLNGHPRCRCTMAPLTAGEYAAAGGAGGALDNQEVAFEALPDATQYDILGPGKYAAWQGGLVTVDDHPDTGVVRIIPDPRYGSQVSERPLYDIVGPAAVPDFVRAGIATRQP